MKGAIIVLVIIFLLAVATGSLMVNNQIQTDQLANAHSDINDLKINLLGQRIISNGALFVEKTKVITLEVNNKKLQETYDSLWTDATSCYWANACTERPVSCEDHFDGTESAWSIQNYMSAQCDSMNNEWVLYAATEAN